MCSWICFSYQYSLTEQTLQIRERKEGERQPMTPIPYIPATTGVRVIIFNSVNKYDMKNIFPFG